MASLFSWLPLIVDNLMAGTALHGATMSADPAPGAPASSPAPHHPHLRHQPDVTAVLVASMLPYAAAALVIVAVAWLAARRSARAPGGHRAVSAWFVAAPLAAGAVPLLCFAPATAASPGGGGGYAVLLLALTAGFAANAEMVAEASRAVPAASAGVGLSVFNFCVAAGGLAGPAAVGALVERSGGFAGAVLLVGLVMLLGAAAAAARGLWRALRSCRGASGGGSANGEKAPPPGSRPVSVVVVVVACGSGSDEP